MAIVTGAAQGIGRAIALAVAAAGAHVLVCDINQSGAASVANEIRSYKRNSLSVTCDVSDADQVAAMVEQALETFGRVDILVNNAGIQVRSPVAEMRIEDWDHTLAVNLRGAFLCTRAVLPHMIRRRKGWIINISSDSGKHGWPTGSAYCASKFGLIGMTESVALEVMQDGIHVNAICPGGVVTPLSAHQQTPAGEPYDRSDFLQPEEIATVAVFLASDEASAFYGASLDAWGRAR